MAYTATDLANIDRAIATGTLRVTIEGKTVEYRSLDDLLRIKATIEAVLTPATRLPTTRRAAFSKGL